MKSTTKSFLSKVALLSITAAASFLHAQSRELAGKVPMDFVVNGARAAAGTYRVIVQRPGIVFLKNGDGRNFGIASLPVRTSDNPKNTTMTFVRGKDGNFRFTGYCAVGAGCWSAFPSKAGDETVQVAVSGAR